MLPSSLGSPEAHRHNHDWPQCHLPARISGLRPLALNLWWTWHQEAREVFRRLDYPLWRLTSHNPVHMLHVMPNQRLTEAARDPTFLSLYDAAIERLGRALMGKDSWWARSFPQLPHRPIAYFSAEFALHQSLPIYAGGLGVLAGDHCKEASDLGIPLVGVGFMYPQGYFHQTMSSEGWQEELYEHLDWDYTPVEQAVTTDDQHRRPALHSARAAGKPSSVCLDMVCSAWPGQDLSTGYRHRGQCAGRSGALGAALRW
jgi:glycogen phosphorylase